MSGYQADPASILSRTFPSEGSEMIVIKDIPFVSMCAHHMLPFYGTARIGYVPGKEIVGLSKLARLLDAYAHRLQIQERLTQQVAQALEDTLAPLGVGVAIEAEHLCMTIRGVRKPGAKTVTSALRGVFLKPETRQEFLSF
jgi:GTP cyclohydrolase I